MRALCGAIIAAGALIGLGFAALGVGERYSHLSQPNADGKVLIREYGGDQHITGFGTPDKDHDVAYVKYSEMDRGLTVSITILIIALFIGIATAFIGLAFHHHRRMQELEHLRRQISGTPAPHTNMHTPASV